MSMTARRRAKSVSSWFPRPVLGLTSEVGFNVNVTVEDATNTVVPWDEFTADVDRVVSMGATWIRTGADMWMTGSWWQTSGDQLGNWYPNTANWEEIRARLQYAHSRGLKILFTTAVIFRDWDDTNQMALNTFDNMVAHNTVVLKQLAAYWGPWISVWGILNEFDATHYRTLASMDGSSSSTITAGYWTELGQVITACSQAIKSAAPHILTTYSAWGFPASASRWQYWRDLYDIIGTDLDIFGVNAYTDYFDPSYPSGNATITSQATSIATTQAHTTMPIVLTETGFPGYYAAASYPVANGEVKAGNTIPKDLSIFKQAGIMVSILYKLRDDGLVSSTNGEDHFGVYYHDGTPKSYRDTVAASCAPAVLRATIPSGQPIVLHAGADARCGAFSWRIMSGGGTLLSKTSAVTLYVAPFVSSDTPVVVAVKCGVTSANSAEKLIRFVVATS